MSANIEDKNSLGNKGDKQELNFNKRKERIESPWRIALNRLKKSKMAVASLGMILLLSLMAIFASVISPFGYNDINLTANQIPANLPTFQIDEETLVFANPRDNTLHLLTEDVRYVERISPVERNREEKYNVFEVNGKKVVMHFDGARSIGYPVMTVDGQAIKMVRKWNRTFILGTDDIGRCVFSRIVYGSRISLSIGFVVVAIRAFLGILLGSLAGYYGGKIDSFIMRSADMVMCFPTLLIIITMVVIVGPSIFNVMIILGILGWPGIARIVRGQILSLREQEFMEAAEALGLSDFRKMFRHLLPNVLPFIVVFATLGIAGAIMTEAALSFIGLGVQPPSPSWGNMIQAARSIQVLENQWWLWVPPGLAIFITVMSFNIFGDGLRDALDPKLKK